MTDQEKKLTKKAFDMGRWTILRDASRAIYKRELYTRCEDGFIISLMTKKERTLVLDEAVDEFMESLKNLSEILDGLF